MNIEDMMKKNTEEGPVTRSEVIEILDSATKMVSAMADGFDLNGLEQIANGLRGVAEAYSASKDLILMIEVLD